MSQMINAALGTLPYVEGVALLEYVKQTITPLCEMMVNKNSKRKDLAKIITWRFYQDYVENHIDIGFFTTYYRSKETLNTIETLGLDPTKFWYLFVFITDFVRSLTVDAREAKTSPIHEIKELSARLDESFECCGNKILDDIKTGSLLSSDYKYPALNTQITLTTENHKPLTISNVFTLNCIKEALEEYATSHYFGTTDNSLPLCWVEGMNEMDGSPKFTTLPDTYKLFYFDKLIREFLDELPRFPKGTTKEAFKSRLFSISGLVDDRRYYTNENGIYKNNLRRCNERTMKAQTISRRYGLPADWLRLLVEIPPLYKRKV